MSDWIDIGDGHSIKYYGWFPDRSIPANAERYANIPDIEKCGCAVKHTKPNGEECMGFIHFNTPAVAAVFGAGHLWQVQSWDPLTVSPSLLCKACGDHGFIRNGQWVKA